MTLLRQLTISFVVLAIAACSSPQVKEPSAQTTNNTAIAEVESEKKATATEQDLTAVSLINSKTGETFALADFAGKTVSIEPMSVTCSSCKKQHQNSKQAREQLPDSEYVFVSLSLDEGLSEEKLAEFATQEGYDWVFAVATPEMKRALDSKFGQTAFNTASTPHFTIAPNREISDLSTGFKEPDELVSKLKQVSEK